VVATVVVRLAHAHTIVSEVDIAVVAEELGHRDAIGQVRGRGLLGCVIMGTSLSCARECNGRVATESSARRISGRRC
jgi:hypothetical protein